MTNFPIKLNIDGNKYEFNSLEELNKIDNLTKKTYLHDAIYKNDLLAIKSLIDFGIDIHKKDIYGRTPLHIAVFLGNYEIVRLLLLNGSDPNIKNNDGLTALNTVNYDDVSYAEIVRLLLSHGSDPNIEDNNGIFPLNRALYKNHKEYIELLVNNGALFNSHFLKEKLKNILDFDIDNDIDKNYFSEYSKIIEKFREYSEKTPNHYNAGQPLSLYKEMGILEEFAQGSAIKYIVRYKNKGSEEKDLLKAMHYVAILLKEHYLKNDSQKL